MDHSCCQDSTDYLERASQISNIVFAAASLALAYYVFVYQRRKDKLSNKLQWFKELVIEPNKGSIYKFFGNFFRVSARLKSQQLTDIQKSEILSSIRANCFQFRRDFIVLLGSVDRELEKDILRYIDDLSDEITRAAFDPGCNLANDAEFESNVELKVYATRVRLFARIFSYEG